MPHACIMRTPKRSQKRSINARGTAAPPHTTSRSDEKSTGWFSEWRRMSFHTVGTPPENVGRSWAISRHSGSGWRKRPGKTKSAPTIHAA